MTIKGDNFIVLEIFNIWCCSWRIEIINNAVNGRFDNRKLNNSKAFYVDYSDDVLTDGDSVNLEDVDIPAGIEYDSASGELKAVGTHIRPQRAVD